MVAQPKKPKQGNTVVTARTSSRGSAKFLNRELMMLAFNRRVLAQAENTSVPVLERLNFLSIVSSNMDEFFEIRVAGVKEQM
ncbi:MAG: hypothetical protein ACK45Y_08105, partial [Betaproteobacteria bacterium]